jgi:outer membrane protein TolC
LAGLFVYAALFGVLVLALVPRLSAQNHIAELKSDHAAPKTAPISISLAEAERRARKVAPLFQSALAARGIARRNRSIARAALLPQASVHGEYLFTQSNGTQEGAFLPGDSGPVFIANNAVHEDISQIRTSETLSVAGAEHYRQTGSLALQAAAEAEIASRGLHVVVTQDYYAVEAAELELQAAKTAQQGSDKFLDLTQKLEEGGEVAHADVLKAQLQADQAHRGVADAELVLLQAREVLGALLFPDPETPFVLSDSLDTNPGGTPIQVPDKAEARAQATRSNPNLRSAFEALKAADMGVAEARAVYLPTLSLNYAYGIDAPVWATTGPKGVKFLGYSAFATLDVPIWDWFATHDRVKQNELLRNQAGAALDYAQRQAIAQFNADYAALKTAAANLASLRKSAREAQESLRLATLQYRAGQAIVLVVVDAQTTYVTAESAAADGALRYHVARANLERLTGTLP